MQENQRTFTRTQSMELKMSWAKILATLPFISLLHAFIVSTEAVGSPNITEPVLPLTRRLPRIINRHFKPFIPEFNWEQQQYLNAHNDLRQKMGVPPLQWNANLTAYAYSWAMQRREDCNYRNHSMGQYGESMFWMQYKDFSPTEVVQDWFSEQKLFDHERNVCKCKIETDECECGHYINVIWKTTKRLGCSGYVYCADQKGLLVVCSYDPPGNYKGVDPLNPGKAPSKLSRRSGRAHGKLSRRSRRAHGKLSRKSRKAHDKLSRRSSFI